jgi:hypothetical protein
VVSDPYLLGHDPNFSLNLAYKGNVSIAKTKRHPPCHQNHSGKPPTDLPKVSPLELLSSPAPAVIDSVHCSQHWGEPGIPGPCTWCCRFFASPRAWGLLAGISGDDEHAPERMTTRAWLHCCDFGEAEAWCANHTVGLKTLLPFLHFVCLRF